MERCVGLLCRSLSFFSVNLLTLLGGLVIAYAKTGF